MGTTRRAVELPSEKANASHPPEGIVGDTPGRGPRADGSDEIPDRQLNIRDR
jgi:hypothetical protein